MRVHQSLPYAALTLTAQRVHAIVTLDITNASSISAAAQVVVERIVGLYGNSADFPVGTGTPGLFPEPYYWWESGLAWDSLIRYWALTGDDTYNNLVREGLLFQLGPDSNFLPPNQTKSEGNDDQSYWALAAMTAAEYGFSAPTAGLGMTWDQIAQNVFASQAARWDDGTCGGGLRWHAHIHLERPNVAIFTFNNGYNYKNSHSTGNLVQLAARLAAFTGNTTYSDWAEKGTQWALDTGLISGANETFGAVYDGMDTDTNCSQINHLQWTAGVGTFLSGSAYAANVSDSKFWQQLIFAFAIQANLTFTTDSNAILIESACAPTNSCTTDQLAGRAVLARALANARDLTPDTPLYHRAGNASTPVNVTAPPGELIGTQHGAIDDVLRASAVSAASMCSQDRSGIVTCVTASPDGDASLLDMSPGLGEALSALELLLANLPAKGLKTANGTSAATGAAGNGTATGPTISGAANSSAAAGASAGASNGAAVSKGSTIALVFGLGMTFALLL
ncbi:hydrolase 76 protein [Teratosphaeriaceae sp. CCFEE 6253]|nr:hydrolase 76 protein [Teratosphaeriaceae sp. CCFEE 6253]